MNSSRKNSENTEDKENNEKDYRVKLVKSYAKCRSNGSYSNWNLNKYFHEEKPECGEKANCDGINLSEEKLDNCDFSGSNFQVAILIGSSLRGVKLKKTQLDLANITNAKGLNGKQLAEAEFNKLTVDPSDQENNHGRVETAKELQIFYKAIFVVDQVISNKTENKDSKTELKEIEEIMQEPINLVREGLGKYVPGLDTFFSKLIEALPQRTKHNHYLHGDNDMLPREIKPQRSEIDKTRSITPDSWVLSVARKVNIGHLQHVFMVLEGINKDGNRFAWYADLTMRGNHPPENKFSKINTDEKTSEDHSKKLLPEIEKNTLRDVKFAAKIWNIDKKDAIRLKEGVENEKKDWEENRKDIPYQILGNESKSAYSSSKGGHNCFTWAREKINQLEVDEINVPISFADWIGTLPSYHIPDPRKNKHPFWTTERVAVVGAVGATGVIIGATAVKYGCTIQ